MKKTSQKQINARERNRLKFIVSGLQRINCSNKDIITNDEVININIINETIIKILETWDDNSKKLGFNVNSFNVYEIINKKRVFKYKVSLKTLKELNLKEGLNETEHKILVVKKI